MIYCMYVRATWRRTCGQKQPIHINVLSIGIYGVCNTFLPVHDQWVTGIQVLQFHERVLMWEASVQLNPPLFKYMCHWLATRLRVKWCKVVVYYPQQVFSRKLGVANDSPGRLWQQLPHRNTWYNENIKHNNHGNQSNDNIIIITRIMILTVIIIIKYCCYHKVVSNLLVKVQFFSKH